MVRHAEGLDLGLRTGRAVDDDGGTQHLGTRLAGGSPIAAIEAAREAGAEVLGAAVIVDRATGAQAKIEALGVPYHYLFSLTDLGLA